MATLPRPGVTLTMDSDFVQIVPELRDLFDAIAAGHDGAIGSRSHDSVLMNYPFLKIVCNRSISCTRQSISALPRSRHFQ